MDYSSVFCALVLECTLSGWMGGAGNQEKSYRVRHFSGTCFFIFGCVLLVESKKVIFKSVAYRCGFLVTAS